jgi:hypothetical protein
MRIPLSGDARLNDPRRPAGSAVATEGPHDSQPRPVVSGLAGNGRLANGRLPDGQDDNVVADRAAVDAGRDDTTPVGAEEVG